MQDCHEVIAIDNLDEQLETTCPSTEMDYLTFRNLVIKQMFLRGDMTLEQMGAQFFPPLSTTIISNIGKMFGVSRTKRSPLKGWSKEDDRFLKDNYYIIPFNELRHKLKRSQISITKRASALGLKKNNQYQMKRWSWSNDQIEYLKRNYKTITTQKLAYDLHKSKNGIISMASGLGLKK